MRQQLFTVWLLCLIFKLSLGKIALLFDENVQVCSEPGKEANVIEMDDLSVVMESDTDVFLNGSVKFPKGLKPPWKSRFYAEQYVRNQWVTSMVDRKIPDQCFSGWNPVEIWYPYLENQTRCPIPAGVN